MIKKQARIWYLLLRSSLCEEVHYAASDVGVGLWK